MSAATNDPTGIDIPKSTVYLSHRQIEEHTDDIRSIEGQLNDPKARIEARPAMVQELQRIRRTLETQAPPDTTPEQRDRLSREERELLDEFKEAMCSQEEMRKKPPGAVGKHQRFEKHFKGKVLRWKNIRRILNKGNEDPDVSNLELYRPTKSTLNMDNAAIPGRNYFLPPQSEAWDKGYDRTFGQKDQSADPEEVKRLTLKLEALEARLNAAPVEAMTPPAAPVQIPKEPKEKPFHGEAACGKEFRASKGQHQVSFAIRGHQKGCDRCKSILAGGSVT